MRSALELDTPPAADSETEVRRGRAEPAKLSRAASESYDNGGEIAVQ